MSVRDDIGALGSMSLDELREEWRRYHRRLPPPKLSRDLLVRSTAYKIQEREFGGLTPSTKRRLQSFAARVVTGRQNGRKRTAHPQPGAKLIRDWQGRTYAVTVMEKGFEFEARWYRSLSEIAREITGAHWSGPRFFGLTSKRIERRSAGDAS